MENCPHQQVAGGFCTSCGLEIKEEILYEDTYMERNYQMVSKMKYSVRQTHTKHDSKLKSILELFGANSYFEEVRSCLHTKIFKGRISELDKILATIFYVLRHRGVPISLADILSLTLLKRQKFLKVMLNNFDYVNLSEDYLHNICTRVREHLRRYELHVPLDLCKIRLLSHSFKSINLQNLCISYYLKDAKIDDIFEKMQLEKFISMIALKDTIRKIRDHSKQNKT